MSEPHAHGVDDCPVHDVKPGLTPAQQRAWVPALIPPDPERDKRVAARRAADAARASLALDALLGQAQREGDRIYIKGWQDGHAACELHHNRHYAVSLPTDGEMPPCAGCGARGPMCRDGAARCSE